MIFKKAKVTEIPSEKPKQEVKFAKEVYFDGEDCLVLPSPIWSIRKAPIPDGLIIPEEGLKVKVTWKDVEGKLVFPGIHIVTKKEYEEAPFDKKYVGAPVRLVECKHWIEVTREVL